MKLPNTLIFDYPTIAAISNFASAQVGAGAAPAVGVADMGGMSGVSAAVAGMASSLPGRRDDGFWDDLLEKKELLKGIWVEL